MFRGKLIKWPFLTNGSRFKIVLELIHTDVCSPISVKVKGSFEYFITFIDDYSRYGYIYLLHCKSEEFEKFKEFKDEKKKQLDKNIKLLHSNRGGEYLFGDFDKYLLDNEILSQYLALGMPQQNGVAKRRNRILLDMVRSMMSYSDISKFLWEYALRKYLYSKLNYN